jgi:hypothetical protein
MFVGGCLEQGPQNAALCLCRGAGAQLGPRRLRPGAGLPFRQNSPTVNPKHSVSPCAGELARSWDLAAFGPVQALTAGPYGTLLALTWDPASQSAMLVHLDTTADADAGAPES